MEEMDLNSRKANGFMPRLIKSDLSEGEVAYFLQHKDEFKAFRSWKRVFVTTIRIQWPSKPSVT